MKIVQFNMKGMYVTRNLPSKVTIILYLIIQGYGDIITVFLIK
jgi:hypothetical protein